MESEGKSMIDDPYKVLGLEQGASADDVKKAYRKMARVYHPDLHPDDPEATQKMNEINEAYDMLTNPEKYAVKRAMQEAQQEQQWEAVYDEGFAGQQTSFTPAPLSDDSPEMKQAVADINAGQAQNAIDLLTKIPSTGRDARWHYLSAMANQMLGNYMQAADYMEKAAQMEPKNQMYQQLLFQLRREAQMHETSAGGFVFTPKTFIYIFFACFFLRLLLGFFL